METTSVPNQVYFGRHLHDYSIANVFLSKTSSLICDNNDQTVTECCMGREHLMS